MNFWWKLSVLVILIFGYTYGVWHVHTWYDTSKQEKVEATEVIKAQEGQKEIIKFQTQIKKIYVKTKDDCINKPIPTDALSLLK